MKKDIFSNIKHSDALESFFECITSCKYQQDKSNGCIDKASRTKTVRPLIVFYRLKKSKKNT